MLTEIDVINHVKDEIQKDQKFMARNDKEYNAFLKGQILGAERAMSFLRENNILKLKIIKDVRYFVF